MRLITLILLLSTLILTGCPLVMGDSAEEREQNTAYSFEQTDFAAEATRTLSSSQFVERLNSEHGFAWLGKDPAQLHNANFCIQNILSAFRFERGSLYLYDVELRDCFPHTTGNWFLESFKVSIYMDGVWFMDDNGSYVDSNGKDYFYITGFRPAWYSFRSFTSVVFRHANTSEVRGYEVKRAIHDSSDMVSSEYGWFIPCDFSDILSMCRIEEVFEHVDSELADDNYTDRTVIDTYDLGIVSNASYYRGGSMPFTFNDWSGTMTCDGNENTPPTYSASNGVDTMSGTYDPSQGTDYLWSGITN